MKRMIASFLIVVMLMSVCAFAETAAPSVTISQVIIPTGKVEVAEDFKVTLKVVEKGTKEEKVFEKIQNVVTVAEKPVAEYFGEEVMTAAVEVIAAAVANVLAEKIESGALESGAFAFDAFDAETFDTSSLVMDEFFMLSEENYDAEYGDVTAVFEFVTPYEDDALLIAMVGILPNEEAEAEEAEAEETEDDGITWIPQQAVASEGKVHISFTQETLELLKDHQCVVALLRAEIE